MRCDTVLLAGVRSTAWAFLPRFEALRATPRVVSAPLGQAAGIKANASSDELRAQLLQVAQAAPYVAEPADLTDSPPCALAFSALRIASPRHCNSFSTRRCAAARMPPVPESHAPR